MHGNALIANGRAAEHEGTWDWKMLVSLGVDGTRLIEANPTAGQLMDLVKGLMYLKEKYPQFWK